MLRRILTPAIGRSIELGRRYHLYMRRASGFRYQDIFNLPED
jgi:hypothetical protein